MVSSNLFNPQSGQEVSVCHHRKELQSSLLFFRPPAGSSSALPPCSPARVCSPASAHSSPLCWSDVSCRDKQAGWLVCPTYYFSSILYIFKYPKWQEWTHIHTCIPPSATIVWEQVMWKSFFLRSILLITFLWKTLCTLSFLVSLQSVHCTSLYTLDSNIKLVNKPHFLIYPSLLSYCSRSNSKVQSEATLDALSDIVFA